MPYKDTLIRREYQKNYTRKWREENPDKVIEYANKGREIKNIKEKERYHNNIQIMKERCRRYYLSNKEKIKQKRKLTAEIRRWKYLHKQYHLGNNWEEAKNLWTDKLKQQNGICAVCQESPATETDHNHFTGVIRGLLCYRCNLALGLLKVDKGIDFLLSAISYVRR